MPCLRLKLIFLCFPLAFASQEDSLNALGKGQLQEALSTKPFKKQRNLPENPLLEKISSKTYMQNDENISWDKFISVLIDASAKQLDNIKNNIKQYYRLTSAEIESVEDAFKGTVAEYKQTLQQNLKRIVEQKKFNVTPEFMLDFMDLSNVLVEQMVEDNLGKIKGRLLLPTKWYKQTMKQKILRQQVKVASNSVETHVCQLVTVCKQRMYFGEYLVEWLRHLMDLSAENLRKFFSAIPSILQKHMHTVKSNLKFKETVQSIVDADTVIQRDTLDFIDEVLTDQRKVQDVTPDVLKKAAYLLADLFELIDKNYDMNKENESYLDSVSKKMFYWIKNKDLDTVEFLELILGNVNINLKIWPLDVQSQIDIVWSNVILL